MKIGKILMSASYAFAIVAAFVDVPYSALILLLAGLTFGVWGLAMGLWGSVDTQLRAIISPLALAAFASYFNVIPGFGHNVSAFVSNLAIYIGATALTIVLRNLFAGALPANPFVRPNT